MSGPLVLPLNAWPQMDKDMWQSLFQCGGLLDETGVLSHLRMATREMLQKGYGRWLGWISKTYPMALLKRPDQRFTPERLEGWLEDLSHTSPVTQQMFVSTTLRILQSAYSDRDWRLQERALKWLDVKARNYHSERKQGRVLSSAVLLDAGLKLAGPEADKASTTLKAAKYRRDGAMVALLALMPMRRRAFIELDLGVSFEINRHHMMVRLTEDMTKNGLPWESPVPKALEPVLRRYVEEVRPWFLSRGDQSHGVLWVDNRGVPYAANHFGERIRQITERLTGVRVSPHLFRDAAATTLSRTSPRDAKLIRPLLGHASFGIAERHYIQASMIEAGRNYAEIMAKKLE